jgi:hypothetical protein
MKVFLLLVCALGLHATVYTVHPTDSPSTIYTTIETTAGCGDTVNIQAGAYTIASGSLTRIYITGKACTAGSIYTINWASGAQFDFTGYPLDGTTTPVPGSTAGTSGDHNRGGWQVLNSSYITVNGANIKGVSALATDSAAALRISAVVNPTITNGTFQNSYEGVSGSWLNGVVKGSIFNGNGRPGSDQQHQLYDEGGDYLTVEGNYFYNMIQVCGSACGQNLHTRSWHTTIAYNWIQDASSYTWDMMTPTCASISGCSTPGDNTMRELFYGNTVVGPNTPGNETKVFTMFADGVGFATGTMNLDAQWNTFYSQNDCSGGGGCAGPNSSYEWFQLSNSTSLGNAVVHYANNVMHFTNNPSLGYIRLLYDATTGTNPWAITGNNNWFDANTVLNGSSNPLLTSAAICTTTQSATGGTCLLTSSTTANSPPFVSISTLDLRPTSSGAFGSADTTQALKPPFEQFPAGVGNLISLISWADSGALQFGAQQYGYGQVLTGDAGAKTITVIDSGPIGTSQTVALSVPDSSHKFKAWFSVAGYPEQVGSPTSCPAPCSISINTELGTPRLNFQLTDLSGTPVGAQASWYIPQTVAPAETSPFTVPAMVHGFSPPAITGVGYTTLKTFAVPAGVSTSNLRLYLDTFNLRDGKASWSLAGSPYATIALQDIVGLSCTSNVCTITTLYPHGLTTSSQVQFQSVAVNTGNPLVGPMFAVQSTPTSTTFTVNATIVNGDYNTVFPSLVWNGATFSNNFANSDQMIWRGSIRGSQWATALMFNLPAMGTGSLTAGTNATLGLRKLGTLADGDHGWWLLDWNVVEPDTVITQIVVGTGGNNLVATATCSPSCPADYVAGNTVLVENAPGPQWRFNGYRVILASPAPTSTTFAFNWGPNSSNGWMNPGETPGTAPFTTTNGTYVAPTSHLPITYPAPVIYAARCLIPASSFSQLNPSTYPSSGGNATNGLTDWTSATLTQPDDYFPAHASNAHCAGCHIQDQNNSNEPYDLAYFNWPPQIVKVAAIGRGLTETQANDIIAAVAAEVTTITPPAKGRPWNPPFQPGCQIDTLQTVFTWFAGCGLEWQETYDFPDMCEFLYPGVTPGTCTGGTYLTSVSTIMNLRALPVMLQLPHILHWWPHIHPQDFAQYFTGSAANWTGSSTVTDYAGYSSGIATGSYANYKSKGNMVGFQTDYFSSGGGFYVAYSPPFRSAQAGYWPNKYGPALYDSQKWVSVKQQELYSTKQLQTFGHSMLSDLYSYPTSGYGMGLSTWAQGENASDFYNGPHIYGWVSNQFGNKGWKSNTNYNWDADGWYHLNAIQTVFCCDWGYYGNFLWAPNESGVSMINMHILGGAFETQVMAGIGSLTGPINGEIDNLGFISFFGGGASLGIDAWADETSKGAILEGEATRLAAYVSLYTTGQWQTYINSSAQGGAGSTAKNPVAFIANCEDGSPCDGYFGSPGTAYLLAVFNHYGVDSTSMTTLTNWANAVFAPSGYTFSPSTTSCSYTGTTNVNRTMTCTGF